MYWLVAVNLAIWIFDASLLQSEVAVALLRWAGIGVLVSLAIITVTLRRRAQWRPALTILFLLGIGVFSSEYLFESFAEYLRLAACVGLYVVLQRDARYSRVAFDSLGHVAQIVVLGSTLLILVSESLYVSDSLHRARYSGLTPHPNILSFVAAVALCFSVGQFTSRDKARWSKSVAALVACCSLYSIYVSDSRAGLLMIVAALSYSVICLLWRQRFAQIGLGVNSIFVALIAITIFPILTVGSVPSLESGNYQRQLSTTERILAWENAANTFIANPFFGGGLATSFKIDDQSETSGLLYAHNAYLTYAASIGLFGVFGFTLILRAIARGIYCGTISAYRDYRQLIAASLLVISVPFFTVEGGLQGVQITQYVLAIALAYLLRPFRVKQL